MLVSSVGFLLAGCGAGNVVVTPVGVTEVTKALLIEPRKKTCLARNDKGKPIESYNPDELADGFNCSEADRANLRAQIRALQAAVKARQAVTKSLNLKP